jgi:hypothetical protein
MLSAASRAGFASEAEPDLYAEPPKQPEATSASTTTTSSENRLIGFLDAERLGMVPPASHRLLLLPRTILLSGGRRGCPLSESESEVCVDAWVGPRELDLAACYSGVGEDRVAVRVDKLGKDGRAVKAQQR